VITRLLAAGIVLTLLSGSGCTVGCDGSSTPTPVVDEVLALPASGPPQLVPQSLGGEYRALPESTASARGVALRLHNVPTQSNLVIYLDGTALPTGSTSGALPPGSRGVFSTSSAGSGTQATILLPLAIGATRARMTIAASNGTSGGRASVVVDTVSGGMATRPEPSDVYFCTRPDTFFLWQRIASGCLHPDRVDPSLARRYQDAFNLFTKLETVLLNEKESPTPTVKMPTTVAEMMSMKQTASDARKAKRNGSVRVAARARAKARIAERA